MTKEVIEGRTGAWTTSWWGDGEEYFESIRCDDGVYVSPEKKKEIHSKSGELCN